MPKASFLELASVLKPLALTKRFSRGQFLFRSGETIRGFYYVISGQVRVYRMDDQGREVEVARLGPGDFLAEAVIFVAETFPVFAQAVRDSECRYFEKTKVLAYLGRDPRAARALINLLAHKCMILNSKIESLGLLTVRQRLARFLLSRCSGAMKCAVDLGMKKSELAELLGTAGETLSRTLRHMTREGLIEVQGRRVTVKDCVSLRAELRE